MTLEQERLEKLESLVISMVERIAALEENISYIKKHLVL